MSGPQLQDSTPVESLAACSQPTSVAAEAAADGAPAIVPCVPRSTSADVQKPAVPFSDVRLQAAGLEAAIEPGQGRGQDNTDQLASDTSGDQLPEILAQDELPEPRSRRGSAVEAQKRVASFIAQQNKSFREDLLQEGLSKGMRRAKRKTGDGSQDLDSSYNTDGDEAWPGPSLTDGIIDGQAAKRPKLTGTQTASRRPASAKNGSLGGGAEVKRKGQNQYTKRARMAELGLNPDGTPLSNAVPNGHGVRRRDSRQQGLGKSGKVYGKGAQSKAGGHPGDGKRHAKGSKAAQAATKKGALGVGAAALKGAVPDVDMHAGDVDAASRASPEPGPDDYDELYGCPKCRFSTGGCGACRQEPLQRRLKCVRWRPSDGRYQQDIPLAPVFHPTAEEFKDPIAYLEKIRPEGERCGIVNIVPPDGWSPPFALDKGTNGQSADSFKFTIRQQLTSHLCMRLANTSAVRSGNAAGRYVDKKPEEQEEDEATEDLKQHVEEDGIFGFMTLEKPQTLKSFAAYGEWTKQLHFSDPQPKVGSNYGMDTPEDTVEAGDTPAGGGNAPSQASSGHNVKRRKIDGAERDPTLEEIEAEFWRIVESPDEVVESLYGQDLDSGHHGSGFPLPPFRQTMLEHHLTQTADARANNKPDKTSGFASRMFTDKETAYSKHAWNINNLPRCKGSVLRYLIGEELITGVMVPWLYVGTALSAFCWHVEDHALYSINYLHQGAPKIWYGVPAHASDALEEACKDAMPHLFAAAPDLLYQLVTMLSPRQLQARGVPVYRVVHNPASFTVTFPNAYHSGFNTGFNIAEAVNFGPPDWIPYGTDVLEKYRKDRKAATLSHDNLLVSLVQGAEQVAAKQQRTSSDAAACSTTAKASDASEAGPIEVEGAPQPPCVTLNLGPASKEGVLSVGLSIAASSEAQTAAASQPAAAASSAQGCWPPREPAAPSRAVDAASLGSIAAGIDSAEVEAAKMPGRATDLSFMDAINVEDAPTRAVQLAAGELALRIQEEQRRRVVGLAGMPQLQARPMIGKPGAKNERGMHTDTEETDCEECKCDLYLFAVVSPMRPGRATCPEHAAVLNLPHHQMILLYRYTLEQLGRMVQTAEALIPGTSEVIKQAQKRREQNVSPNGYSRPVRMEAPPGLPPHIAVHLPPKRSHKKMTPEQRAALAAARATAAGEPLPDLPILKALKPAEPNEAVSASQLNGFGPRPPYPSVARITVRNIFSGLPITNQAPAAVLPVLAPERQVTAPAAQRRVRSRPGGPAVQPDLAAAPQPVSASALQHPTAASGPEDDSTDDMDVEIAEALASLASNISAVQQVLAQASLLHQASSQGSQPVARLTVSAPDQASSQLEGSLQQEQPSLAQQPSRLLNMAVQESAANDYAEAASEEEQDPPSDISAVPPSSQTPPAVTSGDRSPAAGLVRADERLQGSAIPTTPRHSNISAHTTLQQPDGTSRRTITGGAHPRIASWQPSPELGPSSSGYGFGWGGNPYGLAYPPSEPEPATTSGWTVTSTWPNPQPSQAEPAGWSEGHQFLGPQSSHSMAAGSQPAGSHQMELAAMPDDPAVDFRLDQDYPMDAQWQPEDFETFIASNMEASSGGRPDASSALPQENGVGLPTSNGHHWPPEGLTAQELGLPAESLQEPTRADANALNLNLDHAELGPPLDTKLLMMTSTGQPSPHIVSQGL
ncbi:hypothetical protein WJX84_004798 [Apatococcus fuscideae]|uniref:[Histone H3]-trimethyl-L-lysine(9) demethylase n=1 Tax=Apatococcus fuscideae TaxID=2026836 RepID=A0AAW1T6I8_9CHLO